MVFRASQRLIRRLVRGVLRLLLVLVLAAVAAVWLFRWVNPPPGMTMIAERIRLGQIERDWVPLAAMADYLPLSAAAAEDANFCRHPGFDLDGIRAALADGAGSRREHDQPAGGEERLPLAGAELAAQGPRGRLHRADRAPVAEAADHGGLSQRRRDGRGRLRRRRPRHGTTGGSTPPGSGRSARRG